MRGRRRDVEPIIAGVDRSLDTNRACGGSVEGAARGAVLIIHELIGPAIVARVPLELALDALKLPFEAIDRRLFPVRADADDLEFGSGALRHGAIEERLHADKAFARINLHRDLVGEHAPARFAKADRDIGGQRLRGLR